MPSLKWQEEKSLMPPAGNESLAGFPSPGLFFFFQHVLEHHIGKEGWKRPDSKL